MTAVRFATEFKFLTKTAAAAKIIGLDTEGLSPNAIRYLDFTFDAVAAALNISGREAVDVEARIAIASDVVLERCTYLAEHMDGEAQAQAAVDELHKRFSDVRRIANEFYSLPISFYVLAIAGRMIYRETRA